MRVRRDTPDQLLIIQSGALPVAAMIAFVFGGYAIAYFLFLPKGDTVLNAFWLASATPATVLVFGVSVASVANVLRMNADATRRTLSLERTWFVTWSREDIGFDGVAGVRLDNFLLRRRIHLVLTPEYVTLSEDELSTPLIGSTWRLGGKAAAIARKIADAISVPLDDRTRP